MIEKGGTDINNLGRGKEKYAWNKGDGRMSPRICGGNKCDAEGTNRLRRITTTEEQIRKKSRRNEEEV